MTKQEEIREGVAKYINQYSELGLEVCAGMIMDYLHSQGVVIKVERELPHPWRDDCMSAHSKTCETCFNCEILEWAQFDLIEAGLVVVESLVSR